MSTRFPTQRELFTSLPKVPERSNALRVISLTQPWATLCALGEKLFETRGWRTHYRGRIAIAAAKGFPEECLELCDVEPFWSTLRQHGIKDVDALPRGVILSVGELVSCESTTDVLVKICAGQAGGAHEELFGDYSAGRFAFGLRGMVALKTPVPCRGALSIWTAPPDVERAVLEQLEVGNTEAEVTRKKGSGCRRA